MVVGVGSCGSSEFSQQVVVVMYIIKNSKITSVTSENGLIPYSCVSNDILMHFYDTFMILFYISGQESNGK